MYDVIIVGGGPAGLSVGSELAKKLKILVIDKNIAGETTRKWFIPYDVAIKNEDIFKYTYGGVKRYLASTFSGGKVSWETKIFERYPFVKEKSLLSYWIKSIRDNKSDIINQCFYLDHKIIDKKVKVVTSKGIFESKLLIDASGHDSIIRQKYRLNNDYYWWTIYGGIAKYKDIPKDKKIGDYMLWKTFKDTNVDLDASLQDGRPVFEYMILDDETYLFFTLYFRKEKVPIDVAKDIFFQMLRKEEETKIFRDLEILEPAYGYYPSGGLIKNTCNDNVSFIGDAGCWTTPCGWGMAFILNNYKDYSQKIINLVERNKLDKNSLNDLISYNIHTKFQIILNKIMIRFLSEGKAHHIDSFINCFNDIDPQICEEIFTLKVKHKNIFIFFKQYYSIYGLFEFINIAKKIGLNDFIKCTFYFILDCLRKRFFEANNIDICDFYAVKSKKSS